MRARRGAVAAIVVAGLLGVAAGCGGGDDSADRTTTEAPATAPATTGGGNSAAATEEGQIFFASTCSGCHLENGTAAAGVGSKLSDAGLSESAIRDRIVNGGGAMPAGLATGLDLDNVTTYVLSLQ